MYTYYETSYAPPAPPLPRPIIMRVKIILNPASDQGRAVNEQEKIERLAIAHSEADVVLTERRGHATELAREAVRAGYDLVVAAGGDGTVHEVLNGIMHDGKAGAMLGVIPIGSGNDFAFPLNIPLNVTAAVEHLFTGTPHTVDVARIEDENGRFAYFDNNFGVGLDAVVVIKKEKMVKMRGFMLYFWSAVHSLIFYRDEPNVIIQFDDEIAQHPLAFMAIGVGPRGGGGFFLTPDAKQDDGCIDSCTVVPSNRAVYVNLLLKGIKGNHINAKQVTMRKSKRIILQSDQPLPIHIDGEVFAFPADNIRRVTLEVLPGALQVIA